MNLHYEIDRLFKVAEDSIERIDSISSEINKLMQLRDEERHALEQTFYSLLCMVVVNAKMYDGECKKVPLIRLHRQIHECGLRESKEYVERYLNLVKEDIPF